jgi:hypothetical protein
MIATRKKLMDRAQDAKSESKYIDFKGQFNAASTEAWCGIIKDIIAMSNSGGGTIIFGIENDGTANSHVDHAALLAYDTADITNRISKYTGYQFSEIEIVELRRDGKTHACFLVSAADVPIVFTKPGEYETTDKKKKVAFTQGTVYFRHGSKSEPGNRDDLLKWREREIERARKTWMTGIRKVVETAPRDSVTVFPSSVLAPNYGSIVKAAMSTDPSAVRIVPGNAEEIWPHRQGDVIREVNKRIESGRKINSFDITCVKAAYDILKKRPDFAYKPHKKSSPQYSGAFIEWLVEQYEKNKNFFLKAREEYKAPTNIARAV